MSNFQVPYYRRELPQYLSDPYYVHRLPGFIQELLERIESGLHFKIMIEFDPFSDCARCEKSRGSATITLPSMKYFNGASMLHELLHLKIYYLDRVPLLDLSPEGFGKFNEQAIFELDNDLEHFIFVSEEIKSWPSRKAYWCNAVIDSVKKIKANKEMDFQSKRSKLMMSYAFTAIKLYYPPKVTACLTSELKELGWLEETQQFVSELTAVVGGKDQMMKKIENHFPVFNEGDLELVEL